MCRRRAASHPGSQHRCYRHAVAGAELQQGYCVQFETTHVRVFTTQVSEQKALMEFLPYQRAELPCHCGLEDPDVTFDRCQLLRGPQLDTQFRHDCFEPVPCRTRGGLGWHFQLPS